MWNAQWRQVFGTSTLLETKFTGYWGYYYLDPVDPSPYTFDGDTGEYCCGGGGGVYYADRSRNQLQASLTKYADKFGRHSLKFGAEIERSHVRSQGQPYGPAGFYIYSYGGVPSIRRSATGTTCRETTIARRSTHRISGTPDGVTLNIGLAPRSHSRLTARS